MFAILLPVVIAAVLIVEARLLVPRHRRLIALPQVILLVVGGLVSIHPVGPHARRAAAVHITRLHLLLAVGQDDAVVMLRVLQIILCQHRITR
ncbi:MAG: hypothetical protein ACKVP3_10860 [Hyphomicrobiaceae bacterium]